MDNRLMRDAQGGRAPAYWRAALYVVVAIALPLVIAPVLFVVAILMLVLLGGDPSRLIDSLDPSAPGALFFVLFGAVEVMVIAITALWVRLIEKRPVASIGLRTRRPLWEWGRGMLAGGGMILLAVGLMAGSGTIRLQGGLSGSLSGLLSVLGTLLFFAIQGPAEEVVFRGYLLPVLSVRGSMVAGVVVSSLLFGMLHALNPNFGVLPLVNIVLAGVMFALYALAEEGLWGVCGVHSAWNWVQGNVLGLAVSGIHFGPSLFQLQEHGPDWLTGGAFGPEGSVVVTLLLVTVSAGLGWQVWRKQKARSAAQAPDPVA